MREGEEGERKETEREGGERSKFWLSVTSDVFSLTNKVGSGGKVMRQRGPERRKYRVHREEKADQ